MAAPRKPSLKLVHASEGNGLLLQALVELHKAAKAAGFYPKGHPHRGETMQRAFELCRQLLTERELVLGVTRQGFASLGEPVEGNAMVQLLANECFIRRIANVTLMQDLLFADLESLVQLLAEDPQKITVLGGVAKLLEEKGARTVWVNEKDLASIWAKRKSSQDQADDGWEAMAAPELRAQPVEPRSVAALLLLMAGEKSDQRYQELGRELVGRFRDEPPGAPLLPVLEELLRQHEEPLRPLLQKEYALFTLEQLADGAAERLLAPLEMRECPERASIHRVLAALGGKGAYWVIQRLCLAGEVFERKALAAALVAIGPPAVAPLMAMLKDERWYVVRNMAAILGELRSAEALLALKKPLYHDDARVRKESIRALMKIGGDASVLLLLPLLEEQDEGVVRQTVLSLGLMRSREAVPALLRILERRDLLLKELGLKKEVALALGRIGDRRVTGHLLKLLRARGWPVLRRWQELKGAVAAGLGLLGDEAALPALAGYARGKGALAEACREAIDSIERVSGGNDVD